MNSLPDADELGRIVVVAAGFALWKGGRCIAAARWADILRLRAYRPAGELLNTARLGVELRDGTVLEFLEAAPGFELFMDRASATLPGMLPFVGWHPALMLAPAGSEPVVIFERRSLERR